MSVRVVVCQACGAMYNGAEYAQCPYCAGGHELKQKKKRPSLRSLIGLEKKPEPEREYGEYDAQSGQEDGAWQNPYPQNGEMPFEYPPSYDAESRENDVMQIDSTGATTLLTLTEDTSVSGDGQSIDTGESGNQAAPGKPEFVEVQTSFTAMNPESPADESAGTENQAAVTFPAPVNDHIQDIGKTTARYISVTEGNVVVYPVVGWLLCVKGVYYGQSFPLRSGVNRVGRSNDMEISLTKDISVSHKSMIRLTYDTRANEFSIAPGESGNLSYLNDRAIHERVILSGYEEIELGDTGANKFVFIPACGPDFQWSKYPAKKADG